MGSSRPSSTPSTISSRESRWIFLFSSTIVFFLPDFIHFVISCSTDLSNRSDLISGALDAFPLTIVSTGSLPLTPEYFGPRFGSHALVQEGDFRRSARELENSDTQSVDEAVKKFDTHAPRVAKKLAYHITGN